MEKGLWCVMSGGGTHVRSLSSSSDACRLHSEIVALSRYAIRSNDQITSLITVYIRPLCALFIAFSSAAVDPWESKLDTAGQIYVQRQFLAYGQLTRIRTDDRLVTLP